MQKSAAEAYRKEAYRVLGATFFVGPLASIPEERREMLVAFAHMTAHGTRISSATYKENLYLIVALGDSGNVYNDLKLNQSQRIATILRDSLLTTLKAFALPVADVKEIYGLKIEFGVLHKSFLDQYASPSMEKVELFAPSTLIAKFAAADITSQQLIDGCVVLVDGNRIEVSLGS